MGKKYRERGLALLVLTDQGKANTFSEMGNPSLYLTCPLYPLMDTRKGVRGLQIPLNAC